MLGSGNRLSELMPMGDPSHWTVLVITCEVRPQEITRKDRKPMTTAWLSEIGDAVSASRKQA
jgi:hypothetical protein